MKQEPKNSGKRERSSTVGPSQPIKIARTSTGESYIEIIDSDDGDDEVVHVKSGPARGGRPDAEIEVIDLFD